MTRDEAQVEIASPWEAPASDAHAPSDEDPMRVPIWPLPSLAVLSILPFVLLVAIAQDQVPEALMMPAIIAAVCLTAMMPVTVLGTVAYGTILLLSRLGAGMRLRREARLQ